MAETNGTHGSDRARLLPGFVVGLVAVVALVAGFVDNSQPEPISTFAFDENSGSVEVIEHRILEDRSPEVPELPFEDNPDPTQCGIPTPWSGQARAWLSGEYEGELIQSTVLVYDSHLRLDVAGRAPHGTEVEVLMFQANPSLDYYLVDLPGDLPKGWIPAPFLSFEEVDPGA